MGTIKGTSLELQNIPAVAPESDVITVDQLKEGTLAVIVEWPCRNHVGDIVIRFKDSLIGLTAKIEDDGQWKQWPVIFKNNKVASRAAPCALSRNKVRKLMPGETLVVKGD